MIDYTPDSLWALGERIDPNGNSSTATAIYAHADAWEADIGMWKDAERHVDRLDADNAALRERLENIEEAAIVTRDTGDWTALTAALASRPEVTP